MGLKQRIDDALGEEGWLSLGHWSDPHLRSLLAGRGGAYRPVVLTRYAGQTIFSGFRRPQVDVTMILGQSGSTQWVEGRGVEALEDQLVNALKTVPDCYPELLPSEVDYAMRLAAGGRASRSRGSGGGGEATYIAVIIPVMGA